MSQSLWESMSLQPIKETFKVLPSPAAFGVPHLEAVCEGTQWEHVTILHSLGRVAKLGFPWHGSDLWASKTHVLALRNNREKQRQQGSRRCATRMSSSYEGARGSYVLVQQRQCWCFQLRKSPYLEVWVSFFFLFFKRYSSKEQMRGNDLSLRLWTTRVPARAGPPTMPVRVSQTQAIQPDTESSGAGDSPFLKSQHDTSKYVHLPTSRTVLQIKWNLVTYDICILTQ